MPGNGLFRSVCAVWASALEDALEKGLTRVTDRVLNNERYIFYGSMKIHGGRGCWLIYDAMHMFCKKAMW